MSTNDNLNSVVDIDALLDGTLDDLADMPEFKAFPPGAHRVLVSTDIKEINKAKAVEFSFEYTECIELADATEHTAPNAGDKCSILCLLDNEFGVGTLKKLAKPIATALGLEKTSEVIEQCKGIDCVILTSLRKDKKDPDKVYMQVKELAVNS